MKYKQILIIITVTLIGIQINVDAQNQDIIKQTNIQKDTLYDIERNYTDNLDGVGFTERRIPKVRRIFRAGKAYHYKAIYLASNNDTLSNNTVIMKPTGERWKVQPEKQDLIYYEIPDYKADSIKLCNHNINKEFQLWENQTGVGIIENMEKVWMHPIRMNQYKFTEVAPFPEVYLPMEKGKKWSGSLMIGQGWGEWDGQTIENNYEISDQTTYQLGDFKIDCWAINSVAKCSFGESKLTTLFNEEYGFVKMEYQNYENEKLVFELINVEEK